MTRILYDRKKWLLVTVCSFFCSGTNHKGIFVSAQSSLGSGSTGTNTASTNEVSKTQLNDETIHAAIYLWLNGAEQELVAEQFGTIDLWDVSNVTNMTNLFANTRNFDYDLSKWNMSNVRIIDGLFQRSINFQSDISTWDTSNVRSMKELFKETINFSPANEDMISTWDVSKVREMDYMFYNISVLENSNFFNNVDLSTWDTSSLLSLSYAFSYTTNLYVKGIDNWDTSKVVNLKCAFCNTNNFSIDNGISDWDVSSVQILETAFRDVLNFDINLNNWNTKNVINMHRAFTNSQITNTSRNELLCWNLTNTETWSLLYTFCNTSGHINFHCNCVPQLKEAYVNKECLVQFGKERTLPCLGVRKCIYCSDSDEDEEEQLSPTQGWITSSTTKSSQFIIQSMTLFSISISIVVSSLFV